jgi:hypothetical protein
MIGDILILLTILAGLFTIAMYYYTFNGYSNTLSLARNGFQFMTMLVFLASAFLLYYLINISTVTFLNTAAEIYHWVF